MGISGKEAVWPCAVPQNKPALTMFEFPSCFRLWKVNHIAKHSLLSNETRPLSVFRQLWPRVKPV